MIKPKSIKKIKYKLKKKEKFEHYKSGCTTSRK